MPAVMWLTWLERNKRIPADLIKEEKNGCVKKSSALLLYVLDPTVYKNHSWRNAAELESSVGVNQIQWECRVISLILTHCSC